jgi:type II secretory pathway component PulF
MKFQVKALQGADTVVSLVIDAPDQADAMRQAEAGGMAVLSLRRAMGWGMPALRRGARFPLALFAQELLALLEAGLTLVEAIEGLAEKEAHGPTRGENRGQVLPFACSARAISRLTRETDRPSSWAIVLMRMPLSR